MQEIVKVNNEFFTFEVKEGKYYTTSLEMATKFNKRHDNIIRLIENDKEVFEEFSCNLNIEATSYQIKHPNSDDKFLERKMYLLDKDAFMFFAMGLTGREASKWKMNFIKAFNMLVDKVKNLEIERKAIISPLDKEMQEAESVVKLCKYIEEAFNIKGIETVKKIDTILKDNNLNQARKALPSYNNSKFVGTVGEVSNRVAFAYSHFYELSNKSILSARAFNKIAVEKGFISEKERKSTRGVKKFKVLNNAYLGFGKNIIARQNSTQTNIHYYEDSFKKFYDLVING